MARLNVTFTVRQVPKAARGLSHSRSHQWQTTPVRKAFTFARRYSGRVIPAPPNPTAGPAPGDPETLWPGVRPAVHERERGGIEGRGTTRNSCFRPRERGARAWLGGAALEGFRFADSD